MTSEVISKLTDFILCSGFSEEITAGLRDIIEVLKSGKRFWAARDEDGELYLYENLPDREENCWDGGGGDIYELPADLFPSLTWEDEPKLVTLGLFVVDD